MADVWSIEQRQPTGEALSGGAVVGTGTATATSGRETRYDVTAADNVVLTLSPVAGLAPLLTTVRWKFLSIAAGKTITINGSGAELADGVNSRVFAEQFALLEIGVRVNAAGTGWEWV